MIIWCTSVENCAPRQYCDLGSKSCTSCSIPCDPYKDFNPACKEECPGYLIITEGLPDIIHNGTMRKYDENKDTYSLIHVLHISILITLLFAAALVIVLIYVCIKYKGILKKKLCNLRKQNYFLPCTKKKEDKSTVTGERVPLWKGEGEKDPETGDKSDDTTEKESNPANKDSVSSLGKNTDSVKQFTELKSPDNPSSHKGPCKLPPVNSISHSSTGRTDSVHVKSVGQNNQTNPTDTGAATSYIGPVNERRHDKKSKSVKQTNNEQTDQRNNKPINNTCPQQIHVKNSSVQAGDTDEANSTQVQHGEEHHLEINSFFSATQFKTPGSNLEGAAVADGMKKEQENMKKADSVSEIVKLKENVSDNDKQEVKQSIRPHVSVMEDSPDESEETNLKQANQHTRKEPIHNVTTEREPTNTVARTANSRPAISLNPKPPATHPTQPQVNLQQPNVLPYPTQQAYVEPTRPVADPTTKGVLSGVKKTHPNRKIYDDLRGIDWVQGYYSEGKSIIVYADMTRLQEDVALKEITFRTGQPEGKFHLKHEAEIA